ncbi:MAG: hypothetical protein OIN85_00685 [Candidatus Methanoperedens sp.]|nr:hypothetical protein [Candidatus Methanoperedens sp.]
MGSVESAVISEVKPESKTINQLTSAEKAELNALSKEVFGASSRWQKMITKGVVETVMEDVTEYVPNPEDEEKEGTTRTVKVPVKYSNGAVKSVSKYFTVDSVREYMVARKKQLDEIKAMIKKANDEREAEKRKQEALQEAHDKLAGSAVHG